MIGAIILAAGQSRRMGTQKLALPIEDKPLLAHVFDEVSRSRVDEVVVVVSSATDALARQVLPPTATIVINPDLESEMLASIRCGVKALPENCEAALIAIGDQPGINGKLIDAIIAAYQESRCGIVVPSHSGKRGHPTLIAAKYFPEILTYYEGAGLHALLAAHPADIQEVEIRDPSILEDIDRPADYQRAIIGRTQRKQ
jgi:molybdenum cofactor cytidylyltransferase